MSSSKADTSGIFEPVTVQGNQTKLSLPPDAVRIRRNGIEFRSSAPIPVWTELTVSLQSPGEAARVNCSGVIVECSGNRHTGFAISLLFMNLTPQSQQKISLLADSQLA